MREPVDGFEGARTGLSLSHGDSQGPCDVPLWRLDDEGLPAGAGRTVVMVMREVYACGCPLLFIGAPAAVCDVNDLQALKGYEIVPVSALVDAVCIWAPVSQ